MIHILKNGYVETYVTECNCGCKFTYQNEDIQYRLGDNRVQCPYCKAQVLIINKKEYKEEKENKQE